MEDMLSDRLENFQGLRGDQMEKFKLFRATISG